MTPSFHALIRTHHITSRAKVKTLRATARETGVDCLLRSGGVPGMMYVRGTQRADVAAWVETVHDLRYKDYKLVVPVAAVEGDESGSSSGSKDGAESKKNKKQEDEQSTADFSFEEVAEVKEFGQRMDEMGLREWWRAAMGYAKD